ncbi:MAG: hypothetical protein M3081_04935 [Gemmatimonadota bacterium]|nr:hypothetical protein [Gemmatimonadota bacterium]
MSINGIALVVGNAARPALSISAPAIDTPRTEQQASAVGSTNPNVAAELAQYELHRPDTVDISYAGAQLASLLYGVNHESAAANMISVDGTIDFAKLQAYLDMQELTPIILKFDHVEFSDEGMKLASAA